MECYNPGPIVTYVQCICNVSVGTVVYSVVIVTCLGSVSVQAVVQGSVL